MVSPSEEASVSTVENGESSTSNTNAATVSSSTPQNITSLAQIVSSKGPTFYILNSQGKAVPMSKEIEKQLVKWIKELNDENSRETALLELSKRRETVPELAVWLWHSFGTIASLLQETVNTYVYMDPPALTAHQSNRVCNALALLQCVASHKDTRKYFLDARIPMFLYPFLANTNTHRPFEFLRLTSLGVIGALVKTDDPEVVPYLLSGENSEIIPLCLKIMENGSELSKTVATFIVQKILWDERGLGYICATFERFLHVASVLREMVSKLPSNVDEKPPPQSTSRLLKHILRCYLRFSEHPKARDPLPRVFPEKFKTMDLYPLFKEDKSAVMWLQSICHNVNVQSQIVQALGSGDTSGSPPKMSPAGMPNAPSGTVMSGPRSTGPRLLGNFTNSSSNLGQGNASAFFSPGFGGSPVEKR